MAALIFDLSLRDVVIIIELIPIFRILHLPPHLGNLILHHIL